MIRRLASKLFLLAIFALAAPAFAEDGYDAWLRYRPVPQAEALSASARTISAASDTPTIRAAVAELRRGFKGMTGAEPAAGKEPQPNAILLVTAADPIARELRLKLSGLGEDGYLIRSMRVNGGPATVIAANRDIGLLYGAFHLLRLAQNGSTLASLGVRSAPRIKLRMLNHWDNLDRTVERGYAGQSIWDWWKLPDFADPRYVDYARLNASLGLNGTVLNNVNASADSLTAPYIAKAAAVADVLRPYGIKVYLSARFSAPVEIGGLGTADPLDPAVAAWWAAKASEIYRAIPDFGGFLVKANSEGQPGPQDYKRSHADGANMLAAAVEPHGGIVMWRAFVYQQDNPEDRARQAYSDFKPLDGKFADNVLVQVKNGAIDFQPREPFHPLFGAMPRTPLMMEFQITKEYLGFATHLAYLGPLFEEALRADTFAKGKGSTVAEVIDGSLDNHRLSGIAGVANIGSDRNWSGSTFNQANWYVFGRLAWDPYASTRDIAAEWASLTFAPDPRIVRPVTDMMMGSREAVVNYMTPLGLTHLMATGHHYGPGPWVDDLDRPEWNPVYYHRADRNGIGFDRTASGSNAVAQYRPQVARTYADLETVPEQDLLWFHHLLWSHRMASGRSLWEELVGRYSLGVRQVEAMQAQWAALEPMVDAERFAETSAFLRIQRAEAQWWRDASVAYFASVSGLPLPAGEAPPPHPLAWYQAIRFEHAPGHW